MDCPLEHRRFTDEELRKSFSIPVGPSPLTVKEQTPEEMEQVPFQSSRPANPTFHALNSRSNLPPLDHPRRNGGKPYTLNPNGGNGPEFMRNREVSGKPYTLTLMEGTVPNS